MTKTIVQFILERLDEDEAAAKACAEVYPPPWEVSDRGWVARVRADAPSFPVIAELEQHPSINGGWLSERLDHIGRHDPARVLADIAAKRRIIEDCTRILRVDGWEYSDAPDLAEATLRHVAAPYADHPDFQEEWKP